MIVIGHATDRFVVKSYVRCVHDSMARDESLASKYMYVHARDFTLFVDHYNLAIG